MINHPTMGALWLVLRTTQILMGHTSIRTTVKYIQLTRKTIDATKSPLDLLDIPDHWPPR